MSKNHYVAPVQSTYFPERLTCNNINTKEEKKRAKRDYRDRKKLNPSGSKNSLHQFRTMVFDKFKTARLRFNLVAINALN